MQFTQRRVLIVDSYRAAAGSSLPFTEQIWYVITCITTSCGKAGILITLWADGLKAVVNGPRFLPARIMLENSDGVIKAVGNSSIIYEVEDGFPGTESLYVDGGDRVEESKAIVVSDAILDSIGTCAYATTTSTPQM